MERLTHINQFGWYVNGPNNQILHDRYINRLSAYEDTGLTPEEIKDLQFEVTALKIIEATYGVLGKPDYIRELVQAKKDGRLVVFPCKIDDMMGLLQKAAIHAVYEAVLKTGGSKETFIAAKEGIKQRFENFDSIRTKAESELLENEGGFHEVDSV